MSEIYCKTCKKLFISPNRKSVYCSRDCYLKYIGERKKNRKPRSCKMCKKMFVPINRSIIFCSKDCYLEYVRERMNRRTCSCKACKKMFVPTREGEIFCSWGCYLKYVKRTRIYHCEMCGKMFVPKQPDRITFCSRDCAYAFAYARSVSKKAEKLKKRIRICSVCKSTFANKRGEQTYCSPTCAYKAMRRRQEEKSVTKHGHIHVCKYCHKEFIPRYKDKHRHYCSDKCQKIACRANGRANRRARMRDAFVERVYKREIYERDEWMCQLCGESVDPHVLYPDPLSASLDHIIPLANGGTHESNNVQLVHLICNIQKGNRIIKNTILMPHPPKKTLSLGDQTGVGSIRENMSPM
jgi:hypothetical protein